MAIPIIGKIKLNLSSISGSGSQTVKRLVKEEIAEYIEDTILDYVSKGKSPVSGEGKNFKSLKKSYLKLKGEISGSSKPNMELTGKMLDDFDVRIKGSEITFGFHTDASEESKLKAENHNKATVRSNKTKVPKRRFIPINGGKLRPEIMQDIEDIIESYSSEEGE